MGHTVNSITVNAPYDLVFDISNTIERLTELFGKEYAKADVLKREGNAITFRLTDEEGKAWVSKRWLYKDKYFAFASRHDPLFPFLYMKIIWLYVLQKDGVKMTWIQDFELDPQFVKFTDQEIEGFINKHSQDNMKIFKKVIEAQAHAHQ